ncbi:MAG: P-loop NTPase [Candidatus Bathyarchaeota archaeon]|nr:P-loop NTPase [Candidatus Bathyarchaeota archaeon]
MMDPRVSVISGRLKGVKRVIAVSGGKGGVGKSLVASVLALILSDRQHQVGLFDADFTSPSTHVILGASKIQPLEDNGLVPCVAHGLRYMSIVAFSHDEALPLRGTDVSNVLIELFAITRWGELDFLIIDMPPGISDAALDIMRLVRRLEFIIVSTPSLLTFETVRKLVRLLADMKAPVLGVVENMKMRESTFLARQVAAMGVPYLGEIPYDPKVEDALGNVKLLRETVFARKLSEIASKLESCP